MSDPRLPASLADELATLKRRIAALERKAANTIGSNTMTGTLSVEDAGGVERARLGYLGGGRSGFMAGNNPSGGGSDTFLMVSELGLEVPYLALPVTRPNDGVAVTSGAFATIWEWEAGILTTKAIQCHSNVAADAGTTGEVRMGCPALGLYTSSRTILPGTSTTADFLWDLPSGFILGAGPYYFSLEARRTGGAGNVWIYRPNVTIGRTGAETATGI